jgi:ribonuclease D
MANFLHHGDLPDDLDLGKIVAVDGEMMGLSVHRDRLCLVQLSAGDGNAHLVKFDGKDYSAPNLKRLLTDPTVTKIFHVAITDVAVMKKWLEVRVAPVFCTKIASRLCRTYTDRHSMKSLLEEVVGIKVAKPPMMQTSDWGAPELTQEQIDYAADDVLYLHPLREKLMALIEREGRTHLAEACFNFLPYRAELDLYGWDDSLLRYA